MKRHARQQPTRLIHRHVVSSQGKQATGLPKWRAKLGGEWDVPAAKGLTLTANATAASKQYRSADNSLSVLGRTVYDRHALGHDEFLSAMAVTAA